MWVGFIANTNGLCNCGAIHRGEGHGLRRRLPRRSIANIPEKMRRDSWTIHSFTLIQWSVLIMGLVFPSALIPQSSSSMIFREVEALVVPPELTADPP